MTYQISEIFTSIQGEGFWAGVPTTFIRLQGCTVGCPWCDTKYTWVKGGSRMTVSEIVRQVNAYHVVITGGEPTLYNLDELIDALWARKRHYIQLETSGQNNFKGILVPDWITWSPKENLNFDAPLGIKFGAAEVKWVVDRMLELATVEAVWKSYESSHPLFVFMPEGVPPKPENIKKALEWLRNVPYELEHLWRYGDRIHIRIGVK